MKIIGEIPLHPRNRLARKLKSKIKEEEKNVQDDDDDIEIIQPPPPLIFPRKRLAEVLIKNIKEGIGNVDDDDVVEILGQTPVYPRNKLAKKIKNIKIKKTGNNDIKIMQEKPLH